MDSNYAIRTSDLTKYYGNLLAVDHINLEVKSGEIFGFLGPNAAGKTTTVRMLTTLLAPTEGTALLNGYDVVRQSYQAKSQIGIVPEESNVYTELSGLENLIFTGKLYCMPKRERERRALELLELFALRPVQDMKVLHYSKGFRRRLTIAMALIHHPAILFLDEPFAGLDVECTQIIKEQVRQFNAGGTTIFLATHQIEAASQLCDRVAIIDEGQIAAIDTPEQLKRTLECVQSVEVALGGSDPKQQDGLRALSGVTEAVRQGDKIRLYTQDPSALLIEVVAYAQSRGLQVISLNTLGPSLEDVFLAITGQKLGSANQKFHRPECRTCKLRDICRAA